MKKSYNKKVCSWGGFPVLECDVKTEDKLSEIRKWISNRFQIIARGNGRSYGDAALSKHIFSTKRLNKLINFDRLNGVLECESGVLLSEILEVIIPQGYFLFVTPGTKYITVGGAIASDVHGKNHHVDGCFSQCVEEFKLLDENGDILICTRNENEDLFWSTIGGMGLTGIILSAKMKLRNIETSYILQDTIKAKNLDEIFDLFDSSKNWTYNVAWIDCLQKGKNIGKSILFRGEHALKVQTESEIKTKELRFIQNTKPKIPFYLPNFVLNRFTIKMMNYLFYNILTTSKKSKLVNYEEFFYPLDRVDNWNKIYGKKGFIQYQMVIPKKHGKEGIAELLSVISEHGDASFLSVLKLFGKNEEKAYNSFPIEGYTLALDFKYNKNLKILISKLDEIVEKWEGRIYLSKDAMSKSTLTNYLKNVDNSKFVSHQRKRITN